MLKHTPLQSIHAALGARMVDFGGWSMPLQYEGILQEHKAVREAAGLFDISHMGELFVSGPRAKGFLNTVLTNDLARLEPGHAQYTLMCNERGGVVDDLYVYCVGAETYLLIVNAARAEADMAWLRYRAAEAAEGRSLVLGEHSDDYGALAVQGPSGAGFLDRVFPSHGLIAHDKPTDLAKNRIDAFPWGKKEVFVARTGYTGEDGFEIVAPAESVVEIWNAVLEAGEHSGIRPAGLGARDTLRLEMGYPLYGNELDLATTPLEAGLSWCVKMDKGPFCGRVALSEQKQMRPPRKCVAFKMTERKAPPRPGYPIWSLDKDEAEMKSKEGETISLGQMRAMIGHVSSGGISPSTGDGIGMGYVPRRFAKQGGVLLIEVRGQQLPAQIVRKPFYNKADKSAAKGKD